MVLRKRRTRKTKTKDSGKFSVSPPINGLTHSGNHTVSTMEGSRTAKHVRFCESTFRWEPYQNLKDNISNLL